MSASPPDRSPTRIARAIGWFIPDAPRDQVERLRTQLYVVLSFLIAANAGLFAALHTAHHLPGASWIVTWVLVGMCALCLCLPLLLKAGAPTAPLYVLLVAVLQVGVSLVAAFDGGLQSGAMFWMVVVPLVGAFLGGSRLGWGTSAVSIVVGLSMYGATVWGYVFPVSLTPLDAAQHYAINFSCGVAFVAALAALYEGPMVQHFQDLSERLRLINEDLRQELTERQRAQAHAEAASRAKDTLLANMSHEFRTPLTSILGFTELLADEAEPEHRPLLESIDRGGRRLLNTLNSVLDIAWLESPDAALSIRPLDVAAIVSETASPFLPTAVQRGLSFEVQGHESVAFGDAESLRRVLAALIDNAVRFTERGGVVVTIGTEADRAVVHIRDTGLGMRPEFVAQAAQPFRQASEGDARTHEGVGVGLTIARRLVEMMGGTFGIESVYGQGTVVELTLPLLEAAGPPKPAQTVDDSCRHIAER